MPIIASDWPAPDNVLALTTTRGGGCSQPPFDDFNLASHVGDSPEDVEDNRASLQRRLPPGTRIQWLQQEHGIQVVRADPVRQAPPADASWTREPLIACAVLTADCLPVLLCDRQGTVVAAAHAGWRGLSSGVLQATVGAMDCEPAEIMAWLGPAIGPKQFEVGPEVRHGFIKHAEMEELDDIAPCFIPHGTSPETHLADIYALARMKLKRLGVTDIYGTERCTVSEPDQFYSYRRDGRTGRMASLVMLTLPA